MRPQTRMRSCHSAVVSVPGNKSKKMLCKDSRVHGQKPGKTEIQLPRYGRKGTKYNAQKYLWSLRYRLPRKHFEVCVPTHLLFFASIDHLGNRWDDWSKMCRAAGLEASSPGVWALDGSHCHQKTRGCGRQPPAISGGSTRLHPPPVCKCGLSKLRLHLTDLRPRSRRRERCRCRQKSQRPL
jgi:hypothetical protein